MVREVPAGRPHQEHEVREQDERVDAPGPVPGRVERRRQRVEAFDVGSFPGAEEAAVQHLLNGLHHVEVLGRRHPAPGRHHAVRPVERVGERLVPDAGELARLLRGRLLRVEDRRVVELGEGVDEQLPVAADVGPVLVDLRHLVEGVAGDAGAELPEVLVQRGRVVGVEVHEDEPLPHLQLDPRQPVVRPVEVEELRLLLDEGQLTLGAVAPPVVLAGELAARPLRLLAGVVVPDQLVAAVAADVVEGADLPVLPPHHDDGRPGGGDLPGEVAAGAGHLLDPADVEPGPGEDGLALELVVLRRDRVLVRHRRGPELRVVLRPAPRRRLREVRHL